MSDTDPENPGDDPDSFWAELERQFRNAPEHRKPAKKKLTKRFRRQDRSRNSGKALAARALAARQPREPGAS